MYRIGRGLPGRQQAWDEHNLPQRGGRVRRGRGLRWDQQRVSERQQARHIDHLPDRNQIFQRIDAELRIDARIDGDRADVAEKNRVAVRRRLRMCAPSLCRRERDRSLSRRRLRKTLGRR